MHTSQWRLVHRDRGCSSIFERQVLKRVIDWNKPLLNLMIIYKMPQQQPCRAEEGGEKGQPVCVKWLWSCERRTGTLCPPLGRDISYQLNAFHFSHACLWLARKCKMTLQRRKTSLCKHTRVFSVNLTELLLRSKLGGALLGRLEWCGQQSQDKNEEEWRGNPAFTGAATERERCQSSI